MIFLIIISLLVPITIELASDYIDIKHGIYDEHGRDLVWRIVTTVAIGLLAGGMKTNLYGGYFLVNIVECIVLSASIFALLFDYILNKLRRLPWDYLGKGEHAAKSDTLLTRYNPYVILGVKIAIFILSLVGFVYV